MRRLHPPADSILFIEGMKRGLHRRLGEPCLPWLVKDEIGYAVWERRWRTALTVALAIYGWQCLRTPGTYRWLDSLDLAIHETGHLVFAVGGEFPMLLGGISLYIKDARNFSSAGWAGWTGIKRSAGRCSSSAWYSTAWLSSPGGERCRRRRGSRERAPDTGG